MTGADPGRIAPPWTLPRFETVGLYDPRAPNAADRLALLDWLAARGFTVDEMVDAFRKNRLTALAADNALRPGPRFTLAEIAANVGTAPERIEEFRLAAGLLPVEPGAHVFSADDAELFRSISAGMAVFGEQATHHFTRVAGRARRVPAAHTWGQLKGPEKKEKG